MTRTLFTDSTGDIVSNLTAASPETRAIRRAPPETEEQLLNRKNSPLMLEFLSNDQMYQFFLPKIIGKQQCHLI
jgi:hypothetical protein